MSETYCQVILYHEDVNRIQNLATLLAHSDDDMPGFPDCSVESSTIMDNAIIAFVIAPGSMDTDGLVDTLLTTDPDWLYVHCHDTKVDATKTCCRRKGNKSTSKKTLINNIRRKSSQVDLYYALENKELDRIRQLLGEGGINLDKAIDGMPLLFHLMCTDDLNLFKLAIYLGADIHALAGKTDWYEVGTSENVHHFQAVRGMNMLSLAIAMRAKSIARYLLKLGLDVNAIDQGSKAPIHYAAADKATHGLIKRLVESGANINHEDGNGSIPLFELLGGYHYRPAKTIKVAAEWIALGADISHLSNNNANALWAVLSGPQPLIDYVKSKGVTDYQVPDGYYDGLNIRHKLGKSMHANDFRTFVEGFDPDPLEKEQLVDLFFTAASNGQLEYIKTMVDRGVPPYMTDEAGYFAYQHAEEMKEKETVAYLKEQMANFFAESENRIVQARPLYDRFMSVFELIDLQESSGKDLSSIDEFCGHKGIASLQEHTLEYFARSAVSKGKDNVTGRVDGEFNVTFSRPNRFTRYFQVTISTDNEPEIIKLAISGAQDVFVH